MMMNLMMRLWKDEEGQGAIEYGLIIGLVSIALVVLAVALAGPTENVFTRIATWINGQTIGGASVGGD